METTTCNESQGNNKNGAGEGDLPPICIICAYHFLPKGIRFDDRLNKCSYGAARSPVDGKPNENSLKSCDSMRAATGQCGPMGNLFSTKLRVSDFHEIADSTPLPFDSHGLDEPS